MADIKTPFPENNVRLEKKTAVHLFFRALIYAFAILGLLCILLMFTVLGIIRQDVFAPGSFVPKRAVLQIDFDDAFSEIRNDSLLSEMNNVNPLSFNELLMVLEHAGIDDRVQAIAARINVSNLGMAQLQELFNSIKEFRARGKKTYIFAPGFGGLDGGISEYYLASAFDEISMQPNSDAGITAIRAEVPFLRGMLDKFGITPEFFSRYEYKTAMASFTDKKASALFSSDMNRLIGFLNVELVSEMLRERFPQMAGKDMMSVLDQAPYSAEEMLQRNLIDKVEFESDWIDRIKREHQAETVDLIDYAYDVRQGGKGPVVAAVILEGAIGDGESAAPLSSEAVVGARTVLQQLAEIRDNENIKAVIVRINSPGGSYSAANEIWYALEKLKKERKIPIIVSMGNYAASGGYFVALAGDKIFADVSTITGSIGVLGGKFVLEELWKKLGVNWQAYNATDAAGIGSINFKFNRRQKEIFNESLDRVYADFTAKVSKARGISKRELDRLARGRVWTGYEAQENGLIDEIGGFNQALAEAKKRAGIGSEPFTLVFYPKQKSLQEKIREALSAYPSVSARELKSGFGLDFEELNVLKRLKYDAMMTPFIIRM